MSCMSIGRSLYRINDQEPGKGCLSLAHFVEADHWNAQGWGVFWTVNRFDGARKKENCKQILSWAVDLDDGSKAIQLERIKNGPIIPSFVVETARGHHVYFDADDADPENYRDIVERLVEFYNGDKNAKDVCRILRVPSYLHWKSKPPFGIKWIFTSEQRYTENEMRKAFPAKEPEEKAFEQKGELRRELRTIGGGDLWERIWNLDCEEALTRLSGSPYLNGETFSFRKNANGNLNIYVNEKSTSCWIDKNKRIGSHDKGGPSIFQWINWYVKNPKKALEIVKAEFREIVK